MSLSLRAQQISSNIHQTSFYSITQHILQQHTVLFVSFQIAKSNLQHGYTTEQAILLHYEHRLRYRTQCVQCWRKQHSCGWGKSFLNQPQLNNIWQAIKISNGEDTTWKFECVGTRGFLFLDNLEKMTPLTTADNSSSQQILWTLKENDNSYSPTTYK